MTGGKTSYFPSRGAVYQVKGQGQHKYELTPNTLFTRSDGKEGTMIFTGYALNEQEIVAKNACLNDQRVMYTFGKSFGDITITGEMLLGVPENTSKPESSLISFYDEKR